MTVYSRIENLITDPRFQQLKFRQEKSNVFTVVGQTHTEHWHSSFMRWLLDPSTSLRLGHFPLARLLNLYMVKKPDCGFTLRDIFAWDLNKVRFSTEKDASMNGKKRSIDVYGESDDLIIVIENKVNARENYNRSETGQTMDYYNYVEAHKTDKQKALYFFISADRKQKAYADMYVHISYQEMYDCIISKCIAHPQVSEDGKYLLEQYTANLRETVHNSKTPMALVNVDLCKDLYSDHAETLDAVFQAAEAASSLKESDVPECVIYEHYQSIFDEIFLSVDEKYGKTPKSQLERRVVTFTELFEKKLVHDGMRFSMTYDGVVYYARIVLSGNRKRCFLQVLDENREPFRDEHGRIIGLYESSSSAGIDVINLYRKKHNISKMIQTLRGTVYWINENGESVKDLIDKL